MKRLIIIWKTILALIRDKILIFKIIFFDFAIRKNWFINIFLLLLLLVFHHFNMPTVIQGSFIGALSSFNLINGYTFYLKNRQWQAIKHNTLIDFFMFLSEFHKKLQCHHYPIIHNIERQHYDLDSETDSLFIKQLSANNEFYKAYPFIFQKYIELFTNIKSQKSISFDRDRLKSYVEFMQISFDKMNQTLIHSMIIYSENTKFTKAFKEFIFRIDTSLCIYRNSIEKADDCPDFVQDTMNLIKSINAIFDKL